MNYAFKTGIVAHKVLKLGGCLNLDNIYTRHKSIIEACSLAFLTNIFLPPFYIYPNQKLTQQFLNFLKVGNV
jgi:hypothetical protein